MGFDVKKFQKAKYEPRIVEVPVPDLAAYFPGGEPAIMTVRGITGAELAQVQDAVTTNRNLAAVAEALVSAGDSEKVRAVRELVGLSDKVPDETARRLELLILGAVEPSFDRPLAVKFCENHPTEFYLLTNAILQATGQGKIPVGKQTASSETPE